MRDYAHVEQGGVPLSSDAFTGFGKDRWQIHNKEVRDAGNYLLQTVLPRYAYYITIISSLALHDHNHKTNWSG